MQKPSAAGKHAYETSIINSYSCSLNQKGDKSHGQQHLNLSLHNRPIPKIDSSSN